MDSKDFYANFKDIELTWNHVWGQTEKGFWFHAACFEIEQAGSEGKIFSTHSSVHTPRYHPLLPFDKEDGESEYREILFEGYKPVGGWSNFSNDQVDVFVQHNGYYAYILGTGDKTRYCVNPRINGMGHFYLEDGCQEFVKFKGWMDEYNSTKPWGGLMTSIPKKPTPHGSSPTFRTVIVNNWDWVGLQLDNGLDVVAWKRVSGEMLCTVIKNIGKDGHLVAKTMDTDDAVLEGDTLYIGKAGITIKLVELVKEKVFHPIVGMKYSETPIIAMVKDKAVGHGMRERTYGGIKK